MTAKEISVLYSKSHNMVLKPLLNAVGNIKIPSSIAIFNMCSATDCPSKALGLCAAEKFGVKCYAKKAEFSYHPDVLPFRRRQEALWKSITAEEFALQFLMIQANKIKPFVALRLNESGDFSGQADIEKAEKIARILKKEKIVSYCYTSRKDLNFSKVRDLVISGSGFKKEGIKNVFQIVKSKKDMLKGYGLCVGSCAICNRCQKSGMKTAVLAH